MIIALALSDKFTDEFEGLPSGNPTSEQMMNEWANMLFKPERKLEGVFPEIVLHDPNKPEDSPVKTFADIFPPIVIPKPTRVKGIGEDWFRRELRKGLDRNKNNRLNYQGEITLSLEKRPDGDSLDQES